MTGKATRAWEFAVINTTLPDSCASVQINYGGQEYLVVNDGMTIREGREHAASIFGPDATWAARTRTRRRTA